MSAFSISGLSDPCGLSDCLTVVRFWGDIPQKLSCFQILVVLKHSQEFGYKAAGNRLDALHAHCCVAKQMVLDYRAEFDVSMAGIRNSLTCSSPLLSLFFLLLGQALGKV